MQVSLETAYAVACQALGEEVVKGRLLTAALEQKEAEAEMQKVIDAATEAVAGPEHPDSKGAPNANQRDDQGRLGQDKPVPPKPPQA